MSETFNFIGWNFMTKWRSPVSCQSFIPSTLQSIFADCQHLSQGQKRVLWIVKNYEVSGTDWKQRALLATSFLASAIHTLLLYYLTTFERIFIQKRILYAEKYIISSAKNSQFRLKCLICHKPKIYKKSSCTLSLF